MLSGWHGKPNGKSMHAPTMSEMAPQKQTKRASVSRNTYESVSWTAGLLGKQICYQNVHKEKQCNRCLLSSSRGIGNGNNEQFNNQAVTCPLRYCFEYAQSAVSPEIIPCLWEAAQRCSRCSRCQLFGGRADEVVSVYRHFAPSRQSSQHSGEDTGQR